MLNSKRTITFYAFSILQEILYTFAQTYHEDNGVDKILNAVYVVYKNINELGNDAITEIGALNERWSAVFQTLYDSGNPVLVGLAEAADEILDFLSFGVITGEGIGTAGLVDFLDRLLAFFKGSVTDVSISQTEAAVYQGDTLTLTLSFKPVTVKNTNAVWETSDAGVAVVENGVVTAVGPGDATITATTEDGGFVVSCVVRVRADKSELIQAINTVNGAGLTQEQMTAELEQALENASALLDIELVSQERVDAAKQALLDAFYALDLGVARPAVQLAASSL